jgi:nicotine blue oxidoreductase
MGSPKPLLPIDGTTYLQRVVASLRAAGADPVVVVLGCAADAVRRQCAVPEAVIVENVGWPDGMLSSIHTAIEYLEPLPRVDAMMLMPVDQPRVSSATMRAMLERWGRDAAAIATATYKGRHGHPAIFARSVWAELVAAPVDAGARAVVAAHGDAVARVGVDDRWVLVDADTPAGHQAMCEGRAD